MQNGFQIRKDIYKVVIFLLLTLITFQTSDVYAVGLNSDSNVLGNDKPTGTIVNGGIITNNTTWTKEKSPYILNGDVQIGAKLTIESGVTVIGNSHKISIFGELDALGEEKEKINF